MDPQGKKIENYKEVLDYVKDNKENLSNQQVKNELREFFRQLDSNQKKRLVDELNNVFNSSKQEYTNLIKDMYNLGNNFPSHISQAEVIGEASKYLNNFEKDSIRAYQILHGITPEDGVLGYNTYQIMKSLPIKSRNSNSLETAASIEKIAQSEKTAEKTSEDWYGTTLQKIGVSREIAEKLAKQALKVDIITVSSIQDYQQTHGLKEDGKIGPAVYMEMKVGKVLDQANIKIKDLGISEKTANNIVATMEEAKKILGNEKYLKTANTLALSGKVGKYLNDPAFEDARKRPDNKESIKILKSFYTENIEKTVQTIQNDPKAKAEAQATLNTKNSSGGTLGGDMVKAFKGEIEWSDVLSRNKGGMIFAGILAFVFFGNKIPGLNKIPGAGSWYGRVALLFVGGMLGGGELLSYGLDQASKGFSATRDYFSNLKDSDVYKTSKKSTLNFFKELPDTIKGINFSSLGDIWENVKGNISDQYDKITSATFSYNNNLEGKAGYIKPEILGGLTSTVFGDEKFMNTSKVDIAKIKDVGGLKLVLGNTSTLPAGITNQDVVNFMKNIQNQFGEDSIFVKDIFITTSIKNTIDGVFADRQYFENNNLNNKIKTEISNFTSSPDTHKKNAGESLKRAILSGDKEELNKFDAKNYSKLNQKDQEALENIKKEVIALRAGLVYLQAEIDKVHALQIIKSTDTSNETESSITEKIKKLEDIETKFNKGKLKGVDSTNFDTAIYEKKIELYAKAKDLGVEEYDTKLSNLEDQRDVQADLIKVRELELKGNIPGNSSSLEDFTSYLKENNNVFSEAQDLVKKYEKLPTKTPIVNNIIIWVDEILMYLENYETDLKAKMKVVNEKYNKLKESIDSTLIDIRNGKKLDDSVFLNEMQRLSKIGEEYKSIKFLEESDLTDLRNNLSKIGLDAKIVNDTVKNSVDTALEERITAVKSAFDVEISVPDTIKKLTKQGIVQQIKDKQKIIDDLQKGEINVLGLNFTVPAILNFREDPILDQKEQKLEGVKNKVIDLFVGKIGEAKTLTDVITLGDKFETTGLDRDEVDEAIKEKIKKFAEENLNSSELKNIPEAQELYMDFKMKNLKSINPLIDKINIGLPDDLEKISIETIDTVGGVNKLIETLKDYSTEPFKSQIINFGAQFKSKVEGGFSNYTKEKWVDTKVAIKNLFGLTD